MVVTVDPQEQKKKPQQQIAGMGNAQFADEQPTGDVMANQTQNQAPTFGEGFGRGFMQTGKFGQPGRQQLTGAGLDEAGIGSFEQFLGQQGNFKRRDIPTFFSTFQNQPTDGTGQGQPQDPQTPANSDQTIQQGNIEDLAAQGKAISQIGAGQTGEGRANTQTGVNALQNTINSLSGSVDEFGRAIGDIQNRDTRDRFSSANQFSIDALTRALTGNVDQDFLNRVNLGLNEANRLTDFEFSDEGSTGEFLSKSAKDQAAQLAERGLGNSQSQIGAQSELQARREQLKNQAKLANLQRAQDQFIGERGRVTQAGLGAGGTAGSLTAALGNLGLGEDQLSNVIRQLQLEGANIGRQAGQGIADTGTAQQQIGAGNLQTGAGVQDSAIGRNFEGIGLEAQLRQAQRILENMFNQQALNNMTTAEQNEFNRRIMEETIIPSLSGGGGSGFSLPFF